MAALLLDDCPRPVQRSIRLRHLRNTRLLREVTRLAAEKPAREAAQAEARLRAEEALARERAEALPVIKASVARLIDQNPGWALAADVRPGGQGYADTDLVFSTPHPKGFSVGFAAHSLYRHPQSGVVTCVLYQTILREGRVVCLLEAVHNGPLDELVNCQLSLAGLLFKGFIRTAFGMSENLRHDRALPPDLNPATRIELVVDYLTGGNPGAPDRTPAASLVDLWRQRPNLPLWPFWDANGEGEPRTGPPDTALVHKLVSPDLKTLVRWITTGRDEPLQAVSVKGSASGRSKNRAQGQLSFGTMFDMPELMAAPEERVDYFYRRWREHILATGEGKPPEALLDEFLLPRQSFWSLSCQPLAKQREWLLEHQKLFAWPTVDGDVLALNAADIMQLPAVKAWARLESERNYNNGSLKDYLADCARRRLMQCLKLSRDANQIWCNFWAHGARTLPEELAYRLVNWAEFVSTGRACVQPPFKELQPGDRVVHYWSGDIGCGRVRAVAKNERYEWLEAQVHWDRGVPWRFYELAEHQWGRSSFWASPR